MVLILYSGQEGIYQAVVICRLANQLTTNL